MNIIHLKCSPGAQFRLGSASLNRTDAIIHSDTLFSGLATIWAMVYGDVERLAGWLRDGEIPKLQLSSGFYALEHYKADSVIKTIYFIPKPPIDIQLDDGTQYKDWKKIAYISLGVYQKLTADNLEVSDSGAICCTLNLLDNVVIGKRCLCTSEELMPPKNQKPLKAFVAPATSPKVHVHKIGDEDALYSETNLRFKDIPLEDDEFLRGHFYVLVKHQLTEKDWQQVLTCLRILADEGIGGERSTGKGRIESIKVCEPDPILCQPVSKSKYHLLLSMLAPRKNEVDSLLQYDLITRGAWTLGKNGAGPRHRKQVRLIREGALLSKQVRGRLLDISPDNNKSHPIYRSGVGFSLPLGYEEGT